MLACVGLLKMYAIKICTLLLYIAVYLEDGSNVSIFFTLSLFLFLLLCFNLFVLTNLSSESPRHLVLKRYQLANLSSMISILFPLMISTRDKDTAKFPSISASFPDRVYTVDIDFSTSLCNMVPINKISKFHMEQ